MRRWLAPVLVVGLLVTTVFLVNAGRQPQPAAQTGDSAASQATPPGDGSLSSRTDSGDLPMRKFQSGEKPPQIILFSFDGVGDHDKWKLFSDAAAQHGAHITGFLTGTYLLTDKNRDVYTGPGHKPGSSAVGFGGKPDVLVQRINDLNAALAAGHEIGTHYNGHFCEGNEPSAAVWDTAAWNDEITQFLNLIRNYRQNNPGINLPQLAVTPESIKGGRTPCLEGQWDQLVSAWKEHGFVYDTSMNAKRSGLSWPSQIDGIWEFPMPYIYSPAFGGMVVNMDYNMWVMFNGAKEVPESAPRLRTAIFETYQHLYQAAFEGNRAPILIANHFNTWNGDSFNPPVEKFMREYCGRPETYCVTYSQAIAWMEIQEPSYLAQLQDMAPVAAVDPLG